jgi:NTP pyrophosphatase (non-canonical NTP hydrolase)
MGEVAEATRKYGHSEDPKVILLFLLEELGEVARAYLKEEGHKKENDRITETFRQEMGDVFYLILRLAEMTNTDLEVEFGKTLKKLERASK